MKNMIWREAPSILRAVYDQIPEGVREEILKNKKGSMNPNKTGIRIQPIIPNEIYVILSYFDAFMAGESQFFISLACQFIEKRAVELGRLNIFKSNGGH